MQHARVVHELPGRIRLKSDFLRRATIDQDYIEAYFSSFAGVESVRVNLSAGSLIVRYDGSSGVRASVMDALASPPAAAFGQTRECPPQVSRTSLGLHLLAAVVCAVASPPLRLALAVVVGLPVLWAGFVNVLGRGFTAKSLDGVSVALCLAAGKYTAVCAIAFMRLLGDYFKQLTEKRSHDLLRSLLRVQRQNVWLERDGLELEIPVSEVSVDDIIICGPGDLVAIDGVIVSGAALVNKSMITGESIPVNLAKDDRVISGSLVESGRIRIRADRVGAETAMSKVNHFLEQTLRDRALPEVKGEVLADKLAPATLCLGLGTYAWTRDFARTASVTSIDYVCSVKFPSRLSVRSSLYAAARAGLLLKGGRALDALARVDAVVFDKTGTLTTKELRVTDIVGFAGWTRKEVLTLAARLEQHYDHPVARTILAKARRARLHLDPVGEVNFSVSNGVCAFVDGVASQIGCRRYVSGLQGPALDRADAQADRLREQGKMALYVISDAVVRGVIGLQDEVRSDAQAVLHDLRGLGIKKVVVLTGDHRQMAQRLHSRLEGLDEVLWELAPEDKARVVHELREQGLCVAFVGDGVNDAPALVRADLGICMSLGSDLAQASAQAVLLNDDLRSLCAAKRIALRQHGILRQCLVEGAAFNTLLLGLSSLGFLSPLAASLLHNANTFGLMGYASARAGAVARESH
jgi:Cu2+-exporting ATPase